MKEYELRTKLEEYLDKDSSYQLVPHSSNTPHGLSFLHLFGKGAQTKKRKAYESGAKIYYEKGFKDGQSDCDNIQNKNIEKEDYDFLIKLISLMGIRFHYFIGPPQIMIESMRKVETDIKVPLNPGLNVIRDKECVIPKRVLDELKQKINAIYEVVKDNKR